MKKLFYLFFILPIVILGQNPAFEGALGGAWDVTGGRAGSVYLMTNLNDSGAGSFRDAVSSPNRIIVPMVSGTVELTSILSISSNITFLGQLAPQGGVTLTGERILTSGSSNVILRYLKVRPDYNTVTNRDAMEWVDSNDIMIDHCSFSWGSDEILSIRGDSDNVTFQRCLFGDGKTGNILGDSSNPALSENLSLWYNAYYNITHRFPNPCSDGRVDIVGNVIFNWKFRLARTTGDMQLNHIANYYSLGCLPSLSDLANQLDYSGFTPSVYSATNRVSNGVLTSDATDNYSVLWQNWDVDPHTAADTAYRTLTQFPLIGTNDVLPTDGDAAFTSVMNDVGANAYVNSSGNKVSDIGTIDQIYIDAIVAGDCVTYNSDGSSQDYPSDSYYINFHNSVSSAPIGDRTAGDTDNDGMPDLLETSLGLNVGVNDAMGNDLDPVYTNVEVISFAVDGAANPVVSVTGIVWNNDTQIVEVGNNLDLSRTFSPLDATNKGFTLSSSNTSVVSNSGVAVGEGSATLTITTDDGSFTDVMNVTVNPATPRTNNSKNPRKFFLIDN